MSEEIKQNTINYLELYKKLKGRKLINGLCLSIKLEHEVMFPENYSYEDSKREFIEVMGPTLEDEMKLERLGFSTAYWGADNFINAVGNASKMTPLRENLLLIMAAYKDQL